MLLPKLLRAGEHVVVLCTSGLHRTGSAVYLAFRLAGFEPRTALAAIAQIRPVTSGALMEPVGRRDTRLLWEAVEVAVETDPVLRPSGDDACLNLWSFNLFRARV